jgi:hypothetical protein
VPPLTTLQASRTNQPHLSPSPPWSITPRQHANWPPHYSLTLLPVSTILGGGLYCAATRPTEKMPGDGHSPQSSKMAGSILDASAELSLAHVSLCCIDSRKDRLFPHRRACTGDGASLYSDTRQSNFTGQARHYGALVGAHGRGYPGVLGYYASTGIITEPTRETTYTDHDTSYFFGLILILILILFSSSSRRLDPSQDMRFGKTIASSQAYSELPRPSHDRYYLLLRLDAAFPVVKRLSHPLHHSLQADTTENPPNVSIATY